VKLGIKENQKIFRGFSEVFVTATLTAAIMQTDMVLGGTGTCPVCNKPFKVARTRIEKLQKVVDLRFGA
jgi:hypothetical protein